MLPDPSKAAEVAEETFLRALRSSQWFPRDTPFRVSLYRLAIIHSLIQRQPGLALPAGSPELAERRDLVEQIRQGLEEVEDLDRAAFVLREIEQVKVEEAAEILRTSPKKIRESVHRVYLMLTSSRLDGLLGRARGRWLLESSLTRGGND